MFDFGMWEIAVIFVIPLIVIGPEKMPALARKAGLYVGKFRKFVSKIKNDINSEIEAEELKEQLSVKNEELLLSHLAFFTQIVSKIWYNLLLFALDKF